MKTRDGIFHNLKESDYKLSNGDITLFFSSELYRDNFLMLHKSNREKQIKRMQRIAYSSHIDYNGFFDVHYYTLVEKRGFYIEGWNGEMSFEEAEVRYLSTKKKVTEWVKI